MGDHTGSICIGKTCSEGSSVDKQPEGMTQ